MLPLNEKRVKDFAADNASYKRSILERYQVVRNHGFWESAVHSEMIRDGLELLWTPSIVVRHQKSFSFLGFMEQRFFHGRQYGADRSKYFSTIRRLFYIFASPLIPFILLGRITQRVITKRKNLATYASALPIIFFFLVSWSAGELIGYLSTTMESNLDRELAKRRA